MAELSKRLEILPSPSPHLLRGLCLLILLGLELLGLTIHFDAQRLAKATPWWAVGLSYTPVYLHMGLASVAAFLVIVHTWGNVAGHGDPTEWCAPEVFPTEEAAMRYYKTAIRPALARLMAHASRRVDTTVVHRKLE